MLALEGIHASLVSVPVLDFESIGSFLKNCSETPILSVEENVLAGGFGSYLLEVSNTMNLDSKIYRLGVSNPTLLGIGSQTYLRKQSKIDVDAIIESVRNILTS